MHGLCERVGVGMESSSPPPFIGEGGVVVAEISAHQTSTHQTRKTCFHQTWRKHVPLSMVFPHGAPPPPNTFHHLWRLPPTMGGPPNTFCPATRGCPPKGRCPKTAPTHRW